MALKNIGNIGKKILHAAIPMTAPKQRAWEKGLKADHLEKKAAKARARAAALMDKEF